jgi:hypothetical protein
MSNFTEEVCEFAENSFIENFGGNPVASPMAISKPLGCDRGEKWQLMDKKEGKAQTCNYWSRKDERTEQTHDKNGLKYWQITGTVHPGWDCWYEPTRQCVSEDCLNSENPGKSCVAHNNSFFNFQYDKAAGRDMLREFWHHEKKQNYKF